jgi:hypothetical protein
LAWVRTRVQARILARARIAQILRRIALVAHRLDAAREHRAADRSRDAAPAAAGCIARLPALALEPSE